MSEAGENSQAKLPVSSPVSGREILGLTSSPLTEGGKCSLGERVGRHVNVERGEFLLGMVDLLRSLYPIPLISI